MLLLVSSSSFAALTANKIPVTKSGVPSLQDSDITNVKSSSVSIAVPVTVTGAVTASSFAGNATTATSLATTPTKCNAGNYPLGIDSQGNAQNCTTAATAAAGTLTGTTLASNVVSSSLTGVGTISSGTWNGTTLAYNYGGTGLTAAADDSVMVGSGIGWQAQALTACVGANKAVTYDATSNSFGCNTISSSGTPSGNSGEIQYNFSGSFAPASGSSVGNIFNQSSGTATNLTLAPTITQTGTAGYTVFKINPSLNTVGSGNRLLTDWQASGVSVAKVDYAGTFTATSYITVSTSAGEADLYQPSANGSSYFAWKAPSTMTSSVTITVPNGYGKQGQALISGGDGSSAWSNTVVSKDSVTSSATPSINIDNVSFFSINAQATAITSMSSGLSGTIKNGQKLTIRIKDDGTARAITWGSSYASRGVTLPTTTVLGKYLYVGLIGNETTSTLDCIAAAQEQ